MAQTLFRCQRLPAHPADVYECWAETVDIAMGYAIAARGWKNCEVWVLTDPMPAPLPGKAPIGISMIYEVGEDRYTRLYGGQYEGACPSAPPQRT